MSTAYVDAEHALAGYSDSFISALRIAEKVKYYLSRLRSCEEGREQEGKLEIPRRINKDRKRWKKKKEKKHCRKKLKMDVNVYIAKGHSELSICI